MDLGKLIFPCNHAWFDGHEFTFKDKDGNESLVAKPIVCIKCKEMSWKCVKLNLTNPKGDKKE